MTITFDEQADALYMRFGNGAVSETVKLNERTLLDLDSAGNLAGIEILHVSHTPELFRSIQDRSISGIPVRMLGSA